MFLVIAASIAVIEATLFVPMLLQRYELRSALKNGQCTVIEGHVEHVMPLDSSGHGQEKFTIGGVTFSYAPYDLAPGFKQAIRSGGPIREGLALRVHAYNGRIAKLESIIMDENTTATD